MGWKVTSWRSEGLAAVLAEQAQATARGILEAAEREARRIVRGAGRERTRAARDLLELEDMGKRLLRDVRAQRAAAASGDGVPGRAGAPAAAAPRAPDLRVVDLRPARSRRRRSRLRESPLAELFRVTDGARDQRRAGPKAPTTAP